MKTVKKTLAIILAVIMTVTSLPMATGLTSFAAEDDKALFMPEIIEQEPVVPEGFHLTGRTNVDEEGNTVWEAETEASEYGLVNEIWLDAFGNEVKNPEIPDAYPADENGEPVVWGENLPDSYDARDEGIITPVEYQVGGTCWAHAAVAVMETAYLKQYGTTYDISEYHAAWFAKNSYYEGVTDSANDGLSKSDIVSGVLDAGGNMSEFARALCNFSGGVLESRYPFNTEDNSSRVGTTQLAEDMKATFTYDTRYEQDVILEGIKSVPYSVDAIKQAVLDYGAVMVLYYSDDSYYNIRNSWYVGDEYPVAFYHPNATGTNHAVTLVGWDDNFSRENFGTYKPEKDGAWLIKNSWSSRWGNNGYFWISYEDTGIQKYTNQNYVVEVGDPSEYEDIYLHNGFGNVSSTTSYKASANVFTAKNDIYLSKVSYGGAVSKDYTLKIYKGLVENCTDPTAGTLVYTQSGNTNGEEYIDINGDVKISKNDRFSVVVELDRFYYEGTLGTTCKAGDSFYYDSSAEKWVDTAGTDYNNVCIRAIAKYQDVSDTYKVIFRDGTKHSETVISENGTVALPQKQGYTYVLTYNGAEFTGTGITQDTVVNMHCYPTEGEISEKNACTRVYNCIYCSQQMKEPEVNHGYEASVIAPDSQTIGYTKYTCAVCGDYYYDEYKLFSGAVGGQQDGYWWQFSNGYLSVMGEGEFPDYESADIMPWNEYINAITTLNVTGKVTRLGSYMFQNLKKMTSVKLPETVEEIGLRCFYMSNALEKFDCPENLLVIDECAFMNSGITEINYNSKIKTIGYRAFMYCKSLVEAVVPGTVTSLGRFPFDSCSSLKKITVEEGITYVSDLVWGTTALEELVIPSTATNGFFANFNRIKKYTVSPESKYFCSVDGVLYNKKCTELYSYPATKTDLYYKIPDTVTSIDNYAFSHTSGLKYLDMSECKTTKIQDYTFNQTGYSLQYINLPNTLTSLWYQSFKQTNISTLFVPSTVTSYQNPPFINGAPTFYTDSETAKIKEFADANSYTCYTDHTEHNYNTVMTDMTKEPTCKDDGYSLKTCVCGNFEYTVIPATGKHSPAGTGVVTAPTCTDAGYTAYTCSGCASTYTADETPALGHSFVWITDEDATCSKDGAKHEECSRCNEVRNENTVIPATGEHSYKSEITTAATHIKEGLETFTCSVCGDSYTKTIAKIEGHSYTTKVTDPTCTDGGYTTYTCACGDTYTADEIPALGHSFGWIVDEDVTCGKDGSKHEKCSRCGETRSENTVIPATGKHSYKCEITTAATHIKEGLETFTCSVCGDSYTKTIAKLEDHTYTSKVTDPTCTAGGYTTYTCVCGDAYTADEIPALGHSFGWIIDEEATCGKNGSKYEKCSRCGETRSENTVIPATGKHALSSKVTKDPTCTDKGAETFNCSGCTYSYVAEIPAKGHTEVTVTGKAATCTETGLTDGKKCSVCGAVTVEQKTIDKKAHTEVIDKAVSATCTKTGLTEGKHCSVCSTVIVAQTVVPEKGHTEVTDKAVAATCTKTGLTEGKHCSVCSTVIVAQTVIPEKGHTEVTDKAIDPTCTMTGLTEGKHCSVCNTVTVAQKTVPVLGHDMGEFVQTKAPTCTAKGEKRADCSRCDYFETKEIPTVGHSYKSSETAPTCTQKGYTTYTCTFCGHGYTADFKDATGHSYGGWKQTKAPTCTDFGEKQRTCTTCGNAEKAKVARLNHVYNTETIEPTCTEKGMTIYTCSSCGHSYTNDISATGHKDPNEDGVCDSCGEELSDPSENCSCMCHKSGFMGFIWKILKIFYKLFGMNKTCACGVRHY